MSMEVRKPVNVEKGNDNKMCYRCGYNHGFDRCPAIGNHCNNCGGRNHFAKVCKTRKQINEITEDYLEENKDFFIGSIKIEDRDLTEESIQLNKTINSIIKIGIRK